MSAEVVIYTTTFCPYCVRAKQLLKSKGAEFSEIKVDSDAALRREMSAKAGGRTSVPQIWIGDRHVGGCDELHELARAGELDALLAGR